MALDLNEIKTRCMELQKNWSKRNKRFEDWYKLLRMVDKSRIHSKNEKFIGNDPRTFFNLSKHLLATAEIRHTIDTENLTENQKTSVPDLEYLVNRGWKKANKLNIQRGRGSVIAELVAWILSTGWYALFEMATEDKLITEVWNPAEVYPEFDDDLGEPIEVCRVYKLSVQRARVKAHALGWDFKSQATNAMVDIYDLYYFSHDETGSMIPTHVVVINNAIVWASMHPELDHLPVMTGPVAGLPDRGVILNPNKWQAEIGESVLATNEFIYNNSDRVMSFQQQMIKDTAQPPVVQRITGSKTKVDPEKLFTRGYLITIGEGEDVFTLAMPAIPVELRQHTADISDQRERGSLPNVAFGAARGVRVNSLLIAQTTAAAENILQPYIETAQGVLTEVDERWIKAVLKNDYKPYGWTKPTNLPKIDDIEFLVSYKIKVPGDLVSRATVARMINPNYQLDDETTTEFFFPEIKDPMRMLAKARRDKALDNDVSRTIDQVLAYELEATSQELQGNTRGAALYRKAAKALEARLEPQGQGATNGRQPQQQVPRVRQETLPREFRPGQ